jgi:hypothetical protein
MKLMMLDEVEKPENSCFRILENGTAAIESPVLKSLFLKNLANHF